MKISTRLETILINRSFNYRSIQGSSRKSAIQGVDVNTRLLHTIDNEGVFIVPVPLLCEFVNINVSSSNIVNIAHPLSFTTWDVKTVDSMIVYMLRHNMRKDAEIMKVVSEKYGTYYGAEGMILDSEFNILLLNACKCTIEEGKVHVKEVITYINPIVSLADTGIDKHIYTKVLPTYLNHFVYLSIPNNEWVVRDINTYDKPTVIFKNVTSTFLIKPTAPSENMNEGIYNILDTGIDDLVEMVVKCQ
jgi:hypothetical protein